MPTTLTRNRTSGTLLLNGVATVLRGGAYDLLFGPGKSPQEIELTAGGARVNVPYAAGRNPCQNDENAGLSTRFAYWLEPNGGFGPFFQAMQANRCNFLRVFLSGGTQLSGSNIISRTPFLYQRVGAKPRYDVRGAVLEDRWDEPYFSRLRKFVEAANAAGVVVQLSLFNYYDIVPDGTTIKGFGYSPWNAANSAHPGWAQNHLIPATGANPQVFFVTPTNALRTVQKALIRRVMQSLAGLGNVILEVMNEPHPAPGGPADLKRFANFQSAMAEHIVLQRGSLGVGHLVSVNASFVNPDAPTGPSDVEVWKQDGLPAYSDVDVVSYHGLTAMGTQLCNNVCGGNVKAPRVDRTAIHDRFTRHIAAHPDKALLYSTDAVLIKRFIHLYNAGTPRAIDMSLRDGQIAVLPGSTSREAELLRTQVFHWAAKCFAEGNAQRGRAHFHNHSTFQAGLEQLRRAVVQAGL